MGQVTVSAAIDAELKVERWENPPDLIERRTRRGIGHSRYTRVAAELVANTGRWAVIFEGTGPQASNVVHAVRMGRVLCFSPSGDFDACTRMVGDRAVVYARYVGDF